MKNFATIAEYIKAQPKTNQAILKKIHLTIKKVAPKATEAIKYGIPTFVLYGNLVHFGGYSTHIGFYPGTAPIKDFAKLLEPYEVSKGTIRFPLDKPIPYNLIIKITKSCVKRNLAKQK